MTAQPVQRVGSEDLIQRYCLDHGVIEWLWSSPNGFMSLQELCDLEGREQTVEEMQWQLGEKRHLWHDYAPLPGDSSFENFEHLDHVTSCSERSILDHIRSASMFQMPDGVWWVEIRWKCSWMRDKHPDVPSIPLEPCPITPSEKDLDSRSRQCNRINTTTRKPCGSVFSRSYDLTRHEDTIHNSQNTKIRCHLCMKERKFSRDDALARHMRVVHPEIEWIGKRKKRAIDRNTLKGTEEKRRKVKEKV